MKPIYNVCTQLYKATYIYQSKLFLYILNKKKIKILEQLSKVNKTIHLLQPWGTGSHIIAEKLHIKCHYNLYALEHSMYLRTY